MTVRQAKRHSSESAKRLQDVGWTISTVITDLQTFEPVEYILDWPHSWVPPFPELSVVQVVSLPSETIEYQCTQGFGRAPSIGDRGAVVHCHDYDGATYAYEIECVGNDGYTVWLATFKHHDLKLVVA